MSKRAKIWLIAAASLVTIGAIIFAAVMTVYHWDFSRLSTDHFETNTYEIIEEFSDIKVNTDTADILFAASSDNMCRVDCYEEEKVKHSVSVKDGTLNVNVTDNRKWYENIGFSFDSPKITVYLPKTEYVSLVIKASTGSIEIPNEIKVESADISLSTGDIRVNNMSAGRLDISSSTGDITVSDVTCTGDIKAGVTTGKVKMMNITCQNLFSNGSTSDISLKNVIAAGKFFIERSTGDVVFENSDSAEIFVETGTGDVRFDKCDAGELKINTDTGDVTGSLLSSKVFIVHSDTGNINVPETASGGKCKITTDTGDIHITVK